MSDRYEVRSTIPVEMGAVRDGIRHAVRSPSGFQLYDKLNDERLPDTYMSRAEAQEECDRRNGR